MVKQAQQIMQLMEQQLKYGINVVLPEDEITDFDIEQTLQVNKRIDGVIEMAGSLKEKLPECLQKMTTSLMVVDKDKLNHLQEKLDGLKQKCQIYKRKLTVYKRNEKYKYQGHQAVMTNNPYILGREEQLMQNMRNLSIKTEKATGLSQVSRHLSSEKFKTTQNNLSTKKSADKSSVDASYKKRCIFNTEMPCTKISDAHYKSDLVNPFATLNSRDIIKINKRICGYKEKLFLKDKVIQDKIQAVDALSFLH